MYTRILVPIDGSPTSNRGLAEAIRLAKDQKAMLRLLHVIDESFLMFGAGYGVDVINSLRESGNRLVDEARTRAREEGVEAEGTVVETLSRRVADKILEDARAWRSDLIVMGTHGLRGFLHLAVGSDAEAVLHGAACPVLLIRAIEPAQASVAGSTRAA